MSAGPIMKPSSKPISSPSRSDHFPPPLMGFLRTDAASRSRTARSRSSPIIFVRRKNFAVETQEPSSPKVTCMGQVRARRASTRAAASPATCRWFRAVLSFFRRKRETGRKPSNSEPHAGDERENSEEEDEEVRETAFVSSVSSPPKNALILTRCRSAPYRSTSSYGDRRSGEERQPEERLKKLELRKDSDSESCRKRKDEVEDKDLGGFSRALILTRCKSEPARIAEKLFPEIKFRGEGRLGKNMKDSFLPNNGRFID